jgi:hypothetical protein
LLSFGLKFIPPCKINKSLGQQIETSFNYYARSIRLRKQFVQQPPTAPSLLNIPNPAFEPENASFGIENYLTVARRRLMKKVKHYLQQSPPQDPTEGWFKEVHASIHALKGIIIKPSDKGFETVIHDLDWYRTECLRQLSDATTYMVAAPHYPLVWAQLRKLLYQSGRLYVELEAKPKRTRLANYLLQQENSNTLRFARFYCITKLHKTPIVGRPIVASINTATYHASKYLDDRLQGYLQLIPAYLQSSQHLLVILERMQFPPGCVLVAADITSLYPNIPIAEGLGALRAQLIKWKVDREEIDFIVALAGWVLNNNYMEFNSTTYHQISGTAMGTPFAVVFANIFLAHLEDQLQLNRPVDIMAPLLFKRYVDDLFIVCESKLAAMAFITTYNEQFPSIKLTSSMGDSVHFMDLCVHKGQRHLHGGLLDVHLYSSPTHKFLYLTTWSFHPKSVFPSFISAERKRIRINCTDDAICQEHDHTFKQRLLARGYTNDFLQPIFAQPLSRATLLQNAAVSVARRAHRAYVSDEPAPLVFKTQYSQLTCAVRLRHCLKFTRSALDDVDAHKIFTPRSPVMCYTRNESLGDLICSSLFR